MKVKCIYNKGKDLMPFENKDLKANEFGRFGSSKDTVFGELEIGKEYLVMGMVILGGVLKYIVDDGVISACPYQLFEVIDYKLDLNWFFKVFKNKDEPHPYLEAIWGYYELVYDETHYEKLIQLDEETQRIYFSRKLEIEKG